MINLYFRSSIKKDLISLSSPGYKESILRKIEILEIPSLLRMLHEWA